MRNIVPMLMTGAIPLGISSADVQAASNHLKVTQIKVCLTSIGWCTHYMLATIACAMASIAILAMVTANADMPVAALSVGNVTIAPL
jgi:hypothetical protein